MGRDDTQLCHDQGVWGAVFCCVVDQSVRRRELLVEVEAAWIGPSRSHEGAFVVFLDDEVRRE